MIDANTPIPTVEPLLRQALLVAFGGKCFYTGREITNDTMHVDHIVAKSRGGKDCIYNYVPTCIDINLKKSAGHHHNITSIALEAVRNLYAPKVVDVFNALLGAGQYPRPRGRPPGPTIPPAERTKPRSVRLNDERWAKLKGLGTEWLERKIDAA